MISPNVIALVNHLWQSTLFALVVSCLTLLLRKNTARVRCLLWLTASAKFLVPFALLTAIGAHIPWPRAPLHGIEPTSLLFAGHYFARIAQLGTPGAPAPAPVIHAGNYATIALIALGSLWALGTFVVVARRWACWRIVRRALRESTATRLAFVIPVRSSSSQLEPAVVGILHPVLLLPKDLERRLTPAEFRAVLAHERCHVTWKDNLAATLHMLVEAIFWFHPLIWWLGARIVEERERACDEQVLADRHTPAAYAEGILKVCEHYLAGGLACVAGIGGANLAQRIEDIMRNAPIEKATPVRKLVIASATFATFAAPVAIGILTSPHVFAQGEVTAISTPASQAKPVVSNSGRTSTLYLGPPRAWELRDEVWLAMPDPATQTRRR